MHSDDVTKELQQMRKSIEALAEQVGNLAAENRALRERHRAALGIRARPIAGALARAEAVERAVVDEAFVRFGRRHPARRTARRRWRI